MSDADLGVLRVNAVRLVDQGASAQVIAASDIIPIIDAEIARRANLPRPEVSARKRAAPKKKPAPATGHQTALRI